MKGTARANLTFASMLAALAALVALATLATLVGCKGGSATLEMADFDRAYLPALELTSRRDTTGEAVMAVKNLKQHWAVFQGRTSVYGISGAEMDRVGSLILEADGLVNLGNIEKAHQLLQGVGPQMSALRKKYGIEYYLDYLHDFRLYLERIHDHAGKKSPGDISKSDMKYLRKTMPRALELWDKVVRAKFRYKAFRFTKQMVKELEALVAKEGEALHRLDEALAKYSRADIIRAEADMKNYFSDIYFMFGNFAGAKLHSTDI